MSSAPFRTKYTTSAIYVMTTGSPAEAYNVLNEKKKLFPSSPLVYNSKSCNPSFLILSTM